MTGQQQAALLGWAARTQHQLISVHFINDCPKFGYTWNACLREPLCYYRLLLCLIQPSFPVLGTLCISNQRAELTEF